MNKNLVVGAIAVVALVLVVAYSMGYLDDLVDNLDLPGLPGATLVPDDSTKYDDNTLYLALVAFTGKALDRETIFGYISTLDLEMWGMNGQDQTYIGTFYKTAWAVDGYSPDTDTTINGALAVAYTKLLDGKGLLAKSGPMVQLVYGSDVVWIVGDGPVTTWGALITYLTT